MSNRSRLFIRNIHAGGHFDVFLISAVGTVLLIRFYLHLTNYPQLGGDSLHIAHMLWGGLLMLAAMTIMFSFLTESATRLAVLLGGIGFGTFIDEVGKFVTKDNDYFFQPAVAIMYGTFVAFYVTGRLVLGVKDYSRREYLVNALKESGELAIDDLDEDEKRRALFFLKRSDPEHPLAMALGNALSRATLVETTRPNWVARARNWLHETYLRVADLPGFPTALIIFFAVQMIIKLGYGFALMFLQDVDPEALFDRELATHLASRVQNLSFSDRAEITVGLMEAGIVFLGILRVRRFRIQAYRFFRAATLINICLANVFVFAKEEFGALVGFLFNLLVLGILAYLIEREKLEGKGA